jgi:hypothetical protein
MHDVLDEAVPHLYGNKNIGCLFFDFFCGKIYNDEF